MTPQSDIYHRFKLFFSKEYSKLTSWVRYQVSSDDYTEAEDIIQDVALNIFGKADFDTPVENIGGFIYTALRNRIIDHYRKSREQKSIDVDLNMDHVFSEMPREPDEDYEMLYSHRWNLIQEAMKQLPEDHRIIIEETEFNQRSYKELSAEWGVPTGTLLSKKHRGISKLIQLVRNIEK